MESKNNDRPFDEDGRASKADDVRRRALDAIAHSERLLDASHEILGGPIHLADARRYRVLRNYGVLRAGEFVADEHLPVWPARELLVASGYLREDDYRLDELQAAHDRPEDGTWMA
jgi:hypothetical protein